LVLIGDKLPRTETDWAPLIIGVLAGLGARIMGEPMLQNWQRGAVIAAIAVITMIASQQVISYGLVQQNDVSPIVFDNTSSTPDEQVELISDSASDTESSSSTADGERVTLSAAPNAQNDAPNGDDSEVAPPDNEAEASMIKMFNGMAAKPVTIEDYELPGPLSQPNQNLVILLSIAFGTFLAYFLGKGQTFQLQESNTVKLTE
jgi:hypothetical protein